MPIGTMTFNPLSWEQAAAPLEGMQMGQQLAQNNLASIFQGPMAQQELQKQQLANAVAQQTLPYAGPQAQAQLGLTQAQGAMSQAMVPYAGYKAMGPYFGAVAAMQNAQNNADKATIDFTKTPVGQKMLGDPNNTDLRNGVTAALQRLARVSSSGFMNNLQTPGMNGPQSNGTSVTPQPSFGNNNFQNGANNPNIAANQQPLSLTDTQTNNLHNLFGNNQTSNDSNIQGAAQDSYAKGMFPGIKAQQINRALSANAVLNQIDPLMDSVSKFAGLAGKAKQTVSKYAQSAGIDPADPDYSNFQLVKNVKMPIAAGEIGQALGFRATDNQKKMLNDIANPDYWDKSPQQALKEYYGLRQTLQGVEQQITKTPGQAVSSLQQDSNTPLANNNSFNPASYYAQMQANPGNAKALYQSLPMDQRALLKSYHEKQRGQ